MKGMRPAIFVGAAVLLLVCVIVLWFGSRYPRPVPLPRQIATVAEGHPFAIKVRNQVDSSARLSVVLMDLERRGTEFNAPEIVYGFDSLKPKGRMFAVAVNNERREAFLMIDAPESKPSLQPQRSETALDLAQVAIDMSRALEIAASNGLAEFCTLASPTQGNVGLRLFNDSSGNPTWNVIGDGWDEKGPLADLTITVDARTGAVLSHTLTKAVGR